MSPNTLEEALTPNELSAARLLISRILDEVAAELVQAALFGSKARGQGRPDSDVDLLLVFRSLPPDREPQAGHAEWIAEEVAEVTAIPVTVWSVSLADLQQGERTPMLVDALYDALPIWCWPEPLPALPFTPADALRCADSLLLRVEEGSAAFAAALAAGDAAAAAKRARDDIVRLCTALLLLDGVTRPRRAEVVEECVNRELLPDDLPRSASAILAWVRDSFGSDGRDDESPVPPPLAPPEHLSRMVDLLRDSVSHRARRLATIVYDAPTPGTRPPPFV